MERETRPPVIETAALTKRFRGVTALDGVHLRVPRGAVYGRLVAVTVSDYSETFAAAYAAPGAPVEVEDLGLEEIFVALVGAGGKRDALVENGLLLERVV